MRHNQAFTVWPAPALSASWWVEVEERRRENGKTGNREKPVRVAGCPVWRLEQILLLPWGKEQEGSLRSRVGDSVLCCYGLENEELSQKKGTLWKKVLSWRKVKGYMKEGRDTWKGRDTGINLFWKGSVAKRRGFGELRSLGAIVLTSHTQQGRLFMAWAHGPCWPWDSILSTGWRLSLEETRDLVGSVGTEGKVPQTHLFQLFVFHQNFKNFSKPLIAYSVLPKSFFAPSQNWNVTTNSEDKINIPDAHPCSGKIQFCSHS